MKVQVEIVVFDDPSVCFNSMKGTYCERCFPVRDPLDNLWYECRQFGCDVSNGKHNECKTAYQEAIDPKNFPNTAHHAEAIKNFFNNI